MARSTFEGPILSGDNRFGPTRDVGYTDLVQYCDINFANTGGSGTAGYPGSSGQFVMGNLVPNVPATLYTPQAAAYSNAGPTVLTPTADTTTNIYRGCIVYLPANAGINDILVDCGVVPTLSSGSLTSTTVYVSNSITAAAGTPTYAGTAAISAVGRQALSTFTDTQFINQSATSSDFQNPVLGQQPTWFSQVVFTVALVGTSMTTLATGKFYFTIRYTQLDGNIGTITTYPNGNLD